MRKTDKYLIAIVAGIVLLVIAAFAFVLLSPEPQYRGDDTPEATVHNYLLALQQEDFERALSELSQDVPNRPEDSSEMEWDITEYPWQFELQDDTSLIIVGSRITGERAIVTVAETRSYGIFPGDVSTQEIVMRLKQEENGWKLIGGKSYWADDWEK
ncbi:MAG: hypothetical protein GWP61_27285 [Chloroflexi bacterium]|jgi:hypothetical protein|nr:hypothetical protein [Chloroflexota bacterium]